jgi:hypothetical protein
LWDDLRNAPFALIVCERCNPHSPHAWGVIEHDWSDPDNHELDEAL